jgi:hypothetical protein
MFRFTLPEQLSRLKHSCEVNCVAGCCGLEAFDVTSDNVAPWVCDNGVPAALTALTQLEELCHAVAMERGPVASGMDDFNAHWDGPSDCLEYLEGLQRETVRALLSVVGGSLFQAEWMAANDQAARSLVRALAETGEFSQLPILGDALEEAGCRAESLLEHCRRGGRHGRRCWLIDLLLRGEGAGPLPMRETPPRRNRVTPFGELIAVSARGTLMGNRGRLHDEQGRIVRAFAGRRWLLCVLSFRGRRRTIMAPNRYTELFFLDEATGLAAGHRPCAECQHERFVAFRDGCGQGSADAVDRLLDAERSPPSRYRTLWEARLDDLPAGVMVMVEGENQPHLVQAGTLHPWHPEGYGPAVERPSGARVRVLTPPPTVNAIRAGYEVGVHPTATG